MPLFSGVERATRVYYHILVVGQAARQLARTLLTVSPAHSRAAGPCPPLRTGQGEPRAGWRAVGTFLSAAAAVAEARLLTGVGRAAQVLAAGGEA